jgi:hypothetical protein
MQYSFEELQHELGQFDEDGPIKSLKFPSVSGTG